LKYSVYELALSTGHRFHREVRRSKRAFAATLGEYRPVIVQNHLYKRSATSVQATIIETKLATAHAKLGTATLRSELLTYKMRLKKKDQPPATMFLIIEQPTTERWEEGKSDASTVQSSEPARK